METIGAYGGLLSIALHTLHGLVLVANHFRIRSNCCGYNAVVSLDIERTTPPGYASLPSGKEKHSGN